MNNFASERKMFMKKISLVILLSVLLFMIPLNSGDTHHTEAASTSYVNAKQDILLRESANKQANTIMTIKNHTEVKVLSSNTTWSYIQVNTKKGYVYTSALSTKNPKLVATSPTITGGLSPKTGRSYTYNPSFDEDGRKATYKASSAYGVTQLLNADGFGYAYLESKEAFEMGVANSDVFFFSLSYPMKKNNTIADTHYGFYDSTVTNVLVQSTSHTLQTPAGTFKNVVVLKYPNGSKLFLAKGFGIVKITNPTGKTTAELVKVK